MWKLLQDFDRILRGEATRPSSLRSGRIEVHAPGLSAAIVVLGALYGCCMGCFALFNRETPEVRQLLAAVLKVPALFLLTLLVTFPSLYVFNALVGSRLTPLSLLRLLLAALGVTLAVLASFGPIVAFFSLTTANYPFMVLLNVLLFAVAGGLGLAFLLQTLHRLSAVGTGRLPQTPASPPAGGAALPATPPATPLVTAEPAEALQVEEAPEAGGALEHPEGGAYSRNVKLVFRCWVVLFALVGGQMSWVLRPFIGQPDAPFQWFRPRQSNFFEAVWRALRALFS